MLAPGDAAPDFSAPDQSGTMRSIKDFRGQTLVLYFYPKDMTPGCTQQACDFRDNMARIASHGAAVVGISPDSVSRHVKFIAKENLTFPLLADEEHAIADRYDVWKEKTLYGRHFMGIERTTFIIDAEGNVANVFARVRVKGHVDEVIKALEDSQRVQ
ncbi:MAG: thioredoxin-dependent thiol peroxidase [bacterium]|nr:thioredoxin-dependent thiol peroxidase [Candidatus Kapabacteria bacterium]